MYEFIKVKPATIYKAPKKGYYIKAGTRIYIPSLEPFTDLKEGLTYYFNDTKTKVKRIQNYI